MPSQTDNTTRTAKAQEPELRTDEWKQEIVPREPSQLEEQGRVLKAWQRSRQIRSGSDLLRGLLAYVFTVHSFQHLSIWSVVIGLAEVSANDWRKRLRQASAWGQWLLQELLASANAPLPLGSARRMATHLAHRRNAFDLSGGPGHGVASAYRLRFAGWSGKRVEGDRHVGGRTQKASSTCKRGIWWSPIEPIVRANGWSSCSSAWPI
jgi:hypothetical protein